MRDPMHADSLTIGRRESSVIVVDPLKDFAYTNGVFNACYKDADTLPVRLVCEYLEAAVEDLRHRAHLTLCRSKYVHDQFGIEGLEELCTTEEGSASIIPRSMFDDEIRKTDNSILSAGEPAQELLRRRPTLVMTGVTTTSCIGKSIDEVRRDYPDVTLIVPRNAVASRAGRKGDEEALLRAWTEDRSGKLFVVDRLGDILFS